ncbi:hypothetical protein K488DRAFT_81636 [Vararia minispora EC-137]|uniref:Uncharacterized protein n=1 Tax=Vararia minispora EC-137 TaxID=1314806 RepID=A0ACB8QYA1_9AGAM|nr:hypothetical protein K488DRAFT_81636 [Vararia minispora EC-137]
MFSRVRGLFGSQDDATVVNVKWNRERLVVPLSSLRIPLSDLRTALADRTHLPANAFKLIYKGAVLKDNAALLTSYGIAPGAVLQLLESTPTQAPASQKAAPKTEQGTIDQIRAELAAVTATLQPGVDAFLRALAPVSAESEAESLEPPAVLAGTNGLAEQHTRLGELLLQALLRLDAINVEPGWDVARAERKGAVRTVQGVLDRMDGAWREAQQA